MVDTEMRMPVGVHDDDWALAKAIRQKGLTMGPLPKLAATLMACQQTFERGIPGDFVEVGVWRGGNSILAANYYKRVGSDKRVWCYDTFAGMTEPSDKDFKDTWKGSQSDPPHELTKRKFKEGEHDWHNDWCYAALDEVKKNFKDYGLDHGVTFVKGDVTQTLGWNPTSYPLQVSVLRLDTDFYDSTRASLQVLYDRLSKGGILILDDYGLWNGSRVAVDEFFGNRSDQPHLFRIDDDCYIGVKDESEEDELA